MFGVPFCFLAPFCYLCPVERVKPYQTSMYEKFVGSEVHRANSEYGFRAVNESFRSMSRSDKARRHLFNVFKNDGIHCMSEKLNTKL